MTEDLSRFVDAQRGTYSAAIAELRSGKKQGHWMWFVFPQLRGLGTSERANYFGISNLAEARAYLEHPILGGRLVDCTRAVLIHAHLPIRSVFGYPDNLKFISSMTLFHMVPGAPDVFQSALAVFNGSNSDSATLRLLGDQAAIDAIHNP